jgi:hypothetical protein
MRAYGFFGQKRCRDVGDCRGFRFWFFVQNGGWNIGKGWFVRQNTGWNVGEGWFFTHSDKGIGEE